MSKSSDVASASKIYVFLPTVLMNFDRSTIRDRSAQIIAIRDYSAARREDRPPTTKKIKYVTAVSSSQTVAPLIVYLG